LLIDRAVLTMNGMRTMLALLILVAACSDATDPTANLCPGADRLQECSERCKPPDGSPGEVCATDAERACLDECMRSNPFEAWCPA
jgi:hypothetical protein